MTDHVGPDDNTGQPPALSIPYDTKSNGNANHNKSQGNAYVHSKNPFSSMKIGPPKEIHLQETNKVYVFSNQFNYLEKGKLVGNIKDEEYIKHTFSWLNCEVIPYVNKSKNEMLGIFNEICKEDHSDLECFICFFLTHGDDKRRIAANDKNWISIDVIIKKFMDCKTLYGKPKLFFIQACRGNEFMEVIKINSNDMSKASAHLPEEEKAKDADTLVFFPTTQGHVAWGRPDLGSYFIACLCKVLQVYGGNYHIGEVITKVNEILSTSHLGQYRDAKDNVLKRSVEVGEATHTLTFKLFFTPIGNYSDFLEKTTSSV